MASRARVRRHAGDLVPMTDTRDRWLLSKILDENFWDRELVNGTSPFERAEGDDNDTVLLSKLIHQTVFVDHS